MMAWTLILNQVPEGNEMHPASVAPPIAMMGSLISFMRIRTRDEVP